MCWYYGGFVKLLYGTGNAAKITYMRKVLQGLDVEIAGIMEAGISLPDIAETGSDPLENACAKAKAYYGAVKVPVFSCDSGLYIEGLTDSQQPGINVRTVHGKRLTDEEMIEYYSGLVSIVGGQAIARYQNAICLIFDEANIYTCFSDAIASERFILKSQPHVKRNNGFPLDSLSVEMKTGMYYFDLNEYGHIDTDHCEEAGFWGFFSNVLVEHKEK
jgi:XTP/dITP diphosphohydrolase